LTLLENISALTFFRITACFFGLVILFIIPPFQVPDEPDHFERAFHLADGHFFGTQEDQRLGGSIPESIAQLEAVYPPMVNEHPHRQTAKSFKKAGAIALNPDVKTFQDFPNTGLYPFTVYAPQIIVIKIGTWLNIKPLYLFYLVRLGAFLFWFCLVSKAIQLLPERKWLFTFLVLLPSSLFVNTSASGDVVTSAIAFLFFAFCYKTIISKQVVLSNASLLWLALGVILLALNKFIYAPLLLLAFLFPKSAFKQPQHRNLFAIVLMIIAFIVVSIWNIKTSQLFIPKDQYNSLFRESITLNEGVNPKEQFSFIIQHPVLYLKILVISFLDTAQATPAHSFGKFGWEKNYLPTPIIMLLLFTTLFISMIKSQTIIHWRAKLTFVTIATIMSAGLATTLYMMWNPIGNDIIWGLSGRYFIPIFPLIWFGLPQFVNFRYKQSLIIFTTLLSLSIAVFCAYQRYY